MKISAAALSFFILVAALGSLTHGSPAHELQAHELKMAMHQLDPRIHEQGMHRPAECCFSYTRRKIRCVFMKDYFETTSMCSQPAVVFTTKRGQHVCANPSDGGVQNCIIDLKQDPAKDLGEILA